MLPCRIDILCVRPSQSHTLSLPNLSTRAHNYTVFFADHCARVRVCVCVSNDMFFCFSAELHQWWMESCSKLIKLVSSVSVCWCPRSWYSDSDSRQPAIVCGWLCESKGNELWLKGLQIPICILIIDLIYWNFYCCAIHSVDHSAHCRSAAQLIASMFFFFLPLSNIRVHYILWCADTIWNECCAVFYLSTVARANISKTT